MMSTNSNTLLLCANCGKGEEESVALKNCVACKIVKYCSRDCQKAHRSQHKKECRKRAAELHAEALFKQPPQDQDCPICFLRLPTLDTGRRYNSCCGKVLHAGALLGDDQLCPFCRTAAPTSDEEVIKRENKRIEVGDAQAIHNRGCDYAEGICGFPRDHAKALEFWYRAAELCYATAYNDIGHAYMHGRGVERDEKKAMHYFELAAMEGDEYARHNLGSLEGRVGNYDRALKHYMIAWDLDIMNL